MRGGAFKPRTSPYSFQGLGEEGLKYLRQAADRHDLLVVSEVMEPSQIPLFIRYVDILQIGARNMQNFNLLREVGRINKPVLLKRGPAATIEETLLAAEYIMSGGNHEVILCERGIRTFEPYLRNTLMSRRFRYSRSCLIFRLQPIRVTRPGVAIRSRRSRRRRLPREPTRC